MQYNHKNERTAKYVNGDFRLYVYDESSHLVGEYTVTGQPIVEYVWLGDTPIAALYPNNAVVYLLTDHQNKPRRGVSAATKRVDWIWDPDAFGVFQPSLARVEVNLRFPGQYYDKHTGLYYNHHRYYSPQIGRYLEPDPIGLAGGLNPYAYAGNNPVMMVDPSGLAIETPVDVGLAGYSILHAIRNPTWGNWGAAGADVLAAVIPGVPAVAGMTKRAGEAAAGAVKATDSFVDLTAHRAQHILNRHRAGVGKSGKTEFPVNWSDNKILHHVSDVATDPNAVRGLGKWDSPYAIATRDGIEIRVDFYPNNHLKYPGQISTAYPLNVVPNP